MKANAQPRRVAITGATGFIGVNVARGMAELGHDVHCLVRAAHRPWRLRDLGNTVSVRDADLPDAAALDAALAEIAPHWVLHLAAYGAYATQTDVARCALTNVAGSIALMDAAARHGVERFVNAGSSSEYGFKDHAPSEDERTEPNSVYAVTKDAASAYARHMSRSGRLRATTLRLYSVYGPYEEPTRLIPTIVLRGLAGGYPPLAAPEIARDFVYVDDVIAAFVAALTADVPDAAVYNIGTGIQTTLRGVAETSRALFGIAEAPQWGSMAGRTWDTSTWVANTSRADTELGWHATTPFEAGFERTAAWLSERPERKALYQTARTPLE